MARLLIARVHVCVCVRISGGKRYIDGEFLTVCISHLSTFAHAMAYRERREPPNRPAPVDEPQSARPLRMASGRASLKPEALSWTLVKSGVNRELVTIEQKRRGQGTCV